MDLWMHGTGENTSATVSILKNKGFSTVVGGENIVSDVRAGGMKAWLCSGAYGFGGDFASDDYLARDVNGTPRLWFGSTCPNKADVRAFNLESIKKMAAVSGIEGVIIDGARFSSPASSDDFDSFFTCFCTDCMTKAAKMGYETLKMQNAASALFGYLNGADAEINLHLAGLADWFEFRRKTTTEHLLNFDRAVKETADIKTGIYIFTPSLSYIVGQCYEDLRDSIDVFCPMIYREYHDAQGPACLNHEFSVIYAALTKATGAQRASHLLSALLGIDLSAYHTPENFLGGLPAELVGLETKKAAQKLRGKSKLVPIIQLDDDKLDKSIRSVTENGADGVNFFVWRDEFFDKYGDLI